MATANDATTTVVDHSAARLSGQQRAFVLITGASRGIGRAIAVALASHCRHAGGGSRFVLVARDRQLLERTAEMVRTHVGDVRVHPCDLGAATDAQLAAIVDEHSTGDGDGAAATAFEVAICVHNVGTLGAIERGADRHGDAGEWQRYFELNVFSVARLNVRFLERFAAPDDAITAGTGRVVPFVVNVTSKAAVEPFESFTQYCTARAAREMYFRVLAKERRDVRVLNYSPGVVDTAMTEDVQRRSASRELRDAFRKMREGKEMLEPERTAERLVALLAGGEYESGGRIDYYDLIATQTVGDAGDGEATEK